MTRVIQLQESLPDGDACLGWIEAGPETSLMTDETDWQEKLESLKAVLASCKNVLISFSGGVDSSLLAVVARNILGRDALCVILDSETMPKRELARAEEMAASLDLNCISVKHSMLHDPEFAENPPDRCYFCRRASSRILLDIAAERGIGRVADGLNTSDYDDFRPGIRASEEAGIWHPFVEAGISKGDIRKIAQGLGLNFWNRPASACLASRIAYGEKVTAEKLEMVEKAEDLLHDMDISQVRVRAHGPVARIEVMEEDMKKVLLNKDRIVKDLLEIGFGYVALDLRGYRTGSMNEGVVVPYDPNARTGI